MLSTKHQGGVAGRQRNPYEEADNILSNPKNFQDEAPAATVNGKVESITQTSLKDWEVTIAGVKHFISNIQEPLVKVGDQVRIGDQLSTGTVNPRTLTALKGAGAGRVYLAKKMREIYSRNAQLDPRHFDVISRNLIRYQEVTDPGESGFMPGDKIVGPGNAYVAAAKRHVFGVVGIDMVAGPSEILVICDGSTDPDWIAMDLFSQAEHDEIAQSILLCPDQAFIDQVQASINKLLPQMPRQEIIAASLANRGALIKVGSMDEACDIANFIAPEHLELSVAQPHDWLPKLRHAGAIFMGRFTSESLGDYCAGPNHVLPTSRTARFASPLGVYDFQKRTSLIEVSAAGAVTLGKIASVLAHGEGLQAHARSAELRLESQQ
jgi:hypothetical protein